MTVRQLIPEDLAQMAPGPELGVLLGGLNISALTGTDLVEVLRARARQLSHEQAQLLAAMVEIGLCDPHAGPDEVARLAQAPEYAADEIRAALAWTRNAAYREYHFAETLLARLPAVFTALNTGAICRSKAWLFTELCAELTDEQTQVVCERLLPDAARLTTGELAARIKKLAIALDPEWAARRYASAVQDRDVIGYLDEDGTATVTGRRLPADQAAAACARIEDLAKAAKRAGHPGRIGPLRADIYVGLLEGRWQHLTRDQIIADLLAQAVPDDLPQDPTPDSTSDDNPAAPDGGDGAEQPAAGERVGVELRVGLSTLLGRDRHPGEIPGWGPVTAETARTIVAAQRTGEWRYAITDAEGQLILAGITHRRPALPVAEAVAPKRGGIVELHIPAALLTELAAHPDACGEWAAVIADLAAQYATDRAQGARGAPGQDPAARFAGAVLRRHVQIRDRVCVHPGCRCPAHHADLDHTVAHVYGGVTTEANSGPVCRHDHRLKHEGGWRLRQPEPGHFVWISPLGRIYHSRRQPITTDLPGPLPRSEQYPDHAPPVTVNENWPILYWPPPQPDPRPPPARAVDPDEPPPF
ncbi:MAG: HNH endonuclease signature motif containing protein [Pseudonocardiaceae bacterium]